MGREHDVASPDDIGRPLVDPDAGLTVEFSLDELVWVLLRLETRERPALVNSSLTLIDGQALNYWCDR